MKADQITTKCHIAFISAVAGCLLSLFLIPDVQAAKVPETNRIVFSMNEDIFTMNPDGTGRVRLTFGAHAEFPQFSPNGRIVAFFGNVGFYPYGIYLVKSKGGTPIFLVENSYYLDRRTLSWSPDGSKLAFTCPPSGGICSINVDGSDFRVIDSNANDHAPDWSPDGSRIVFTRGTVESLGDEIFVMKANGGDQRRLTTNFLPDAEPRWSADAKRIAFTHRDGCFYAGKLFCFASYIWVMDADGGNQVSLYGGDILVGDFATGPSWSPDGKIGFGATVQLSKSDFPGDIFRINPDGSGLINVTNTPDMSEGFPDWPQISPGSDDGGY